MSNALSLALAMPGLSQTASLLNRNTVMSPTSMEARLKSWRKGKGKEYLDERELLQDMLYILQGIDGTHVKLAPLRFGEQDLQATEEIVLDIDAATKDKLQQSTVDLLQQLSELGYLYRKIRSGIDENSSRQPGMIEQSLYYALQTELTEYYRLIAILEARILPDQLLTETTSLLDIELPLSLDAATGLTLVRLSVWTEHMKLRLRLMNVLVDGCQRARGGALVSLIYTYTSHGDPFIRNFTNSLLESVAAPFFACLARWIYEGELADPFDEFFVETNAEFRTLQFGGRRHGRRNPAQLLGMSTNAGALDLSEEVDEAEERGIDAHLLWQKKFGFREEMLPTFVNEQFGRKIYSTGKSLNFIKYSCNDSDWVATRSTLGNAGKSDARKTLRTEAAVLQYSDISGLENTIESAYTLVSQRLIDIFVNKYNLLKHLGALKDYLLLGRGDFFDSLVELLSPYLIKPAESLERHHLTMNLETAMRVSSCSDEDDDVARRLDARISDYAHGEIGWDCFTLEYKVDAPVDTVLDPDALDSYLRVFNQLWRTKRVETSAIAAWRKVMINAKTYGRVAELRGDFHLARTAISEMSHFLRQLQYFAHQEVISCAWQQLEKFIAEKKGDLDALIGAHQQYLDRIESKILFKSSRAGKEDALLRQVREVFNIVLQYEAILVSWYSTEAYLNRKDSLCDYALSEATRQEAAADELRGLPPLDLPQRDPETLPGIRRRLSKCTAAFQEAVVLVISALAVHPDLDLRFLSVRLNFSLHYTLQTKRKPKSEAR